MRWEFLKFKYIFMKKEILKFIENHKTGPSLDMLFIFLKGKYSTQKHGFDKVFYVDFNEAVCELIIDDLITLEMHNRQIKYKTIKK